MRFRDPVVLVLLCGCATCAVHSADKVANAEDYAELLQKAQTYYEEGNYHAGIPAAEKCLQAAEKTADPMKISTSLNNLAELYRVAGQFAKAEAVFQRGVEFDEKQFGADSPETAEILNNFGLYYFNNGQYGKAEALFQRSMAIREKQYGPNHEKVANSLCNLACLYDNMGQSEKAETLYQRSLAIGEKQFPDDPQLANILYNLGVMYESKGQYVIAEADFQRGLSIFEKRFGPDHSDIAHFLNALAELYCEIGQYDKAEPLSQRALSIVRRNLGADHPQTANSINELGKVYQGMRRYALAEPLLKESLAIFEKQLGPEHPTVARGLNNLAAIYAFMGEYEKSEPLFLRALSICEKQLGAEHPYVAQCLNNLAALYQDMGQYAKAEPLFQRSLTIREKQLGPDHPFVATSLSNLSGLCGARASWKQALDYGSRALRTQHRYLSGMLPFLSESAQAAFLRSVQNTGLALSFGLHASDYPPLAHASAEWLLNSKGILSEVQSERARLLRQTANTAAAELGQRLSALRAQLAQAVISTPKPGEEEARFARIKDLQEQDETLSRKLGQALGSEFRADSWVMLDEFRQALPAGAVFVNIARFSDYNFKATGQEKKYGEAHYMAWLTFPAGAKDSVAIVDLGEAEKIDAVVKTFRTAAEQTGSNDANAQLKALAALVLRPLEAKIGSYGRWLISPDSALWLVPFAALPQADGKLAIDSHTIQYLISGRELVAPGYKVELTPAAILADPDYDLGLAQAAKGAPIDQGVLLITRSANLKGAKFGRLDGTRREAEAIKGPLAVLLKSEPVLWMNAEASKTNFFKLRCPHAVVLSTHGFFLEEQERVKDPRTGEMRLKPGAENPLLRCGLVLAGANNREAVPEGADDGILSGLEIATSDLRGTELAVLSACETGVGSVNNGEGVAGLRQCFELAGAKSVLATLWHVEDSSNARLMTDFFNNLASGQSKPNALRNAQLAMIKSLKDQGRAPHPYFWAALTVTGR